MTNWAYSTEGFKRTVHDVGGVETVVYEIGHGAPLVYYHGGGTFHGFEWARQLADGFRVICPHHPNFGESADADFAGIGDYVAHHERLFDGLGLGRVHLSGASMGGHMAARHAGEFPGRIDRLALVSPAGLKSDKAAVPDWRLVPPEDVRGMFVADIDWLEPFWPAAPSAAWLDLREREMAAAASAREDLAATDRALREGLKHFDRPTLLLWGEDDKVVPVGFAEAWGEVLPHAELAIIPGGSHLLLDEFPAAVAALRRFLEA